MVWRIRRIASFRCESKEKTENDSNRIRKAPNPNPRKVKRRKRLRILPASSPAASTVVVRQRNAPPLAGAQHERRASARRRNAGGARAGGLERAPSTARSTAAHSPTGMEEKNREGLGTALDHGVAVAGPAAAQPSAHAGDSRRRRHRHPLDRERKEKGNEIRVPWGLAVDAGSYPAEIDGEPSDFIRRLAVPGRLTG